MITFGVLGTVEAHRDGVALSLGAAKQRQVLVRLLLARNRAAGLDDLVIELWGQHPPASASANLRMYASNLRRLLTGPAGQQAICRHGSGYRLTVDAGGLDADRFEDACERGRAAAGSADLDTAVSELTSALRMWRGEPAEDVAHGDFVQARCVSLAEARACAVEDLATAFVRLGSLPSAMRLLEDLTAADPLRERAQQILMLSHYAAGDTVGALRVYESTRRGLAVELGIDPGRELQQLHQAVLRQHDPQELVEQLGAAPGHAVTHLGDDAAAAGAAVQVRPFQLPADAPDFVGRHGLMARLATAMTADSGVAYPAVASITGMPGVGKSTLAVHAAHCVRERYPDGQLYIDLYGDGIGTLDPHDAIGRVLTGLGFAASALPATLEGRSAVLRSVCADRRLLLVLDNASTFEQVAQLLPANSQCGVLVTSRSGLGGMTTWPQIEVEPLDDEASLDLLGRIVGRQRVADEPQAAERMIELCAGLPLAIRIVGARHATRPHQGLAWLAARLEGEQTRLDELAVPGAALRSSFDISYRDLAGHLQRALRLLSLLEVPDFSVWLAAAALGCSLREAEDHLDGLISARLLDLAATGSPDVPRFRFHQLIKLYAKDLADSAESEHSRTSSLARAYEACLGLAEHMDQGLRRHDKRVSSGRGRYLSTELLREFGAADPNLWLAAERGTLVAVVHASAARGWHDLAWDLSLTLQRFLESHGLYRDWMSTATAGLAAARRGSDRRAVPALLCSIGEAHIVQDEIASAAEMFSHALRIARELRDGRAQAEALRGLAVVHRLKGQMSESAAVAREALGLLRQHPDAYLEADLWMSLASVQRMDGTTEAESSYRRALDGFVAIGDRMNQAILLVSLGSLCGEAARWAESQDAFSRAAAICREISFRSGEAFAHAGLGIMLKRRGDNSGAEWNLKTALAIVRDYADRFTESTILIHLGELARETDLARSRQHYLAAIELQSDEEMPTLLADALIGLGETEELAGDLDRTKSAWLRAYDLLRCSAPERAVDLRNRLDSRQAQAGER
jgi:DNA-binding SARP family transcriptional activator/tetratricopeptide (TPR) repeat protein